MSLISTRRFLAHTASPVPWAAGRSLPKLTGSTWAASSQLAAVITPGAVLSVAVWILASMGFGFYVQNFGNYNATYGSIGAVIILMMWLYLSVWAVLLGGAINAELDARMRRQ